ncbi:MAG: response regulator [Hyphomicrobiales bacterium]|nr:response regulator [Hyphomicrobiales bacterium]
MTKTVLVVEDHEMNMKLFRHLLESLQYRILEARNGVDAVKLARAEVPDLILMDMQLPGGASGTEVTQWIKQEKALAHIPIIAVTAFAMKGDEEKFRQSGCDAYMSKPISVVKFLETVKTYLGDSPEVAAS